MLFINDDMFGVTFRRNWEGDYHCTRIQVKTMLRDQADDTPMHEALREALANCLINTDYYGSRGVVITLHPNRITLADHGYSRTGKIQMQKIRNF